MPSAPPPPPSAPPRSRGRAPRRARSPTRSPPPAAEQPEIDRASPPCGTILVITVYVPTRRTPMPATLDRTAVLTVAEAAESRRSIRLYEPEPIPREDLEEILRLTGLAPSAF